MEVVSNTHYLTGKYGSQLESAEVLVCFFFSLCFQAPQFVDIQLAEEDSSDEEYCPDEEEEDETAEDVRDS